MGAKPCSAVAIVAAVVVLGGCAELNLARFAPPGIIKYEDIAGDQPMNEQIEERIAERKAAGGRKTPRLSEQPQQVPKGASKAEREALLSGLRTSRDTVSEAVARDRESAFEERSVEVTLSGEGAVKFEETAEALSRAVERDTAAARAERNMPPAPADEEAGKQE